MIPSLLKLWLINIVILVLSGCAQKTTVALLADPDGHVGNLAVISDSGETVLNQATQATVISAREKKPTDPQTENSLEMIPQILQSISQRNSKNISVIGHSDTAGDRNYNLRLSRERALIVQQILVRRGVDQAYISSTSHGKENPLIKTGDNVEEPRNRRVEVIIR